MKVEEIFEEMSNTSYRSIYKALNEIPHETYYDSDIPDKLPKDLNFSP